MDWWKSQNMVSDFNHTFLFLSTMPATFVTGALPLKYFFKTWTHSSWIQWKNFNKQHWTHWLLYLLYKYSRAWEIHRSYITDKGSSLFIPLHNKSNGKSLVLFIMATLSHLLPWFQEWRTKQSLAIFTKSLTLWVKRKAEGPCLGL